MKILRCSILILLVVSPFAANVFGQTAATARVSGVVTDAQGAVVAGATVKLIDKTTRLERSDATNSEGRYVFASVEPGLYEISVTAQGFRTTTITEVKAEVAKVTTVDLSMQAGNINEEVTVNATGEVQLQRDDAAIGNIIDGDRIKRLPNLTRQATVLLVLQPTVTPNGEVSGARRDQNSFLLDGLDVSDQVGFRGAVGTVVPIPTESVEQFRVTVANPNATFGRSGGGQVTLVTKRGTNAFHGSAYEYHQNDNLNANSWSNNRNRLAKPPLIDNRFGFSVGGPLWKNKLFFFGNYEGRRRPGSAQITRTVPTQSLRDGQLRFRDAAGNIQTINPRTFDDRALGANPQILAYLRTLPLPNTTGGDGLNTGGFTANLPTTLRDDFGALRLDYQINQNWSVEARGSLFRNIQRAGTQVDLINLQPGDRASSRPKNLTFALTGTLRPNLVNEVRIGHGFDNEIREQIAPTTIAGFNVPVNIAQIDEAIDVDFTRARDQTLSAANTQITDNATWSKGAHTFQFGGTLRHISTFHYRDDKVGSALSTPLADIGAAGSVTIPASQRPPTCSATVTQNCLQNADVTRYNQLYASLLGLVNNVAYMAVRDADLKPLPAGTGLINDVVLRHWEFYFSDVWRVKPSFTFTYGLQYLWHTPPVDELGRQTVLAYRDSKELIDPKDYLRQKKAAAEAGNIFNPDVAYLTLKDAGRDGTFDIQRGSFAPRISAAWQPTFDKGWLGSLFGNRKMVVRGGYSLVYDRLNTVESVVLPMLGVGFTQTLSVAPRNSANQAFRAGIDGPIPVPANFAVTSPVVPAKGVGITTAFGELISLTVDPKLGNPRNHTLDFTLQRELPGKLLVEVGYVGRLGRNLFQSLNLNSTPYFFKDKASGQTFAQAFDAVAAQLRSGVAPAAVTLQPWFENQLAGTAAATNGATRFLASAVASAFINGDLGTLWNVALDGIAPNSYNNRQVLELHVRTTLGRANYHALFITLHKRTSHGLTFDFNYTLSKSLDQLGSIQNDGPQFSSSFDPDIDYGPSDFDRTHIVNANFVYDLPFGSGRRFDAGKGWDRVIGGWYVAGIYQAVSGAPIAVSQGNPAFGSGLVFGPATGAIPLKKPDVGNSVHRGVIGSGNIGTTGNPANAVPGSGLNLFANPEEVYRNFRRINLASDTRQGRGVLRGLPFWNLDLSLGKETKFTERVKLTLAFDFFNVLNRVNFNTPGLSLLSPTTFGVITGAGAPRRIQVGGRVEF
jgi:hypothetical protein